MVSNVLKPDQFHASRLLSRGMGRPSCLLSLLRDGPHCGLSPHWTLEDPREGWRGRHAGHGKPAGSTLLLMRHEGIWLQNQISIKEPGCLISTAFVLRFAVLVKLWQLFMYVCSLCFILETQASNNRANSHYARISHMPWSTPGRLQVRLHWQKQLFALLRQWHNVSDDAGTKHLLMLTEI